MNQKSFDLIKFVRWIMGVLIISVPILLLRGLFFGTAEGYPGTELNDIWSIVLFFIAGVLVLPIEFNIGKRRMSIIIRVLLIVAFLLTGLLIL